MPQCQAVRLYVFANILALLVSISLDNLITGVIQSSFSIFGLLLRQDVPEDAVVTMCGHVFCYQCIYERITTDENMCPSPNCGNTLSTDSVFSSGALRICMSGVSSSHASGSSSLDDESSSISQTSYISSKIQAAIDILNSIINTYALTDSDTVESNPSRVAPVKAIVFSQWTGMLDLLELSLNSNLIQYRRLDGTMSLNSRDKAVKDFNTDPEVPIFCFHSLFYYLVSLITFSHSFSSYSERNPFVSSGQGYDHVTESR